MLPRGCDPLSVGSSGRLGGGQESLEKMLRVVSSHLLNKAAGTATGMVGWVFLIALKTNMDGTLRDAVPVHNVQRRLEELEERILTLEQQPRSPEEHSLSDSEVVSDDEDEHYETVGPCWAVRPVVQQKVKPEQPVTQGGTLNGPQCD